jgi:hypothetical protein
VPYCHIFLTDREVERGEEIQEVKTQCPGAQEEWDEEGEAGQEGKGQKTRAEAHPGSDGSITVSSGTADPRWHDRRSVNRHRRQQRHRAPPIVRRPNCGLSIARRKSAG